MPQAAIIPIAAAVIGAGGAAVSANQQKKAAEAQAKKTGIPADIFGLRGDLASLFQSILGGGGIPGQTSPLIESARSRLRESITPDALEQRLLGQNPFDVLKNIGDSQRPAFLDTLGQQLTGIESRFGQLGGLRPGASSDLTALSTQQVGLSTNQFEAQLQSLFPSVQANFNNANSIIDSLLTQGIPGFEASALNQQLAPLQLATQFATAFPGAQPILPTASPLGSGLSSIAGGLGNAQDQFQFSQILKLLQQNQNQNQTGTN